MSHEISGNLLPLVEYASGQGLATEINAASRRPGGYEIAEPYSVFYRAAITSPLDAGLYETVVADFGTVDPDLRYSILAETLKGLDDETVLHHRAKVMQLVGAPEPIVGQTLGGEVGIRSELDRAVVFDRLQHLGLTAGFTFNQEYFFDNLINPDNGFQISFDELLSLKESFDPGKKSKDELVAAFAQWADDPAGGRQVMRMDGMAFRYRDMAMGYHSGRKGEPVSETEAMKKVEDYLATGSHDLVVAYVEDLLFARSPAGLALMDALSARGFRGLLLEGSEQLPKAYGMALAAAGRLDDAQAVAVGPRIKYEDYAYINLEIARTQRKQGDPLAAITTLDNLRGIDPLFHFADRADPDEYIGMMGGSPLGFMNENMAEEYAHCGAFDKALEAYRHSRQYPQQTEPAMAQIAVGLGLATKYFSEILSFDATEHENLFMISRLSVALLNRLNSNLELGETFSKRYPEIAAQVPALVQRLQAIQTERGDDRTINRTLVEIYTATGNYDEALAILRAREVTSITPMEAFGRILTDMAYRGEYQRAIELYDQEADRYKWLSDVDVPQFNIAVMGWSLVNGQRETFDRFLNLLPDYKRSLALFAMLQKFEAQNLHIDDDLARLIMRGEFYGEKMAKGLAAVGRLLLGRSAIAASHTHILR